MVDQGKSSLIKATIHCKTQSERQPQTLLGVEMSGLSHLTVNPVLLAPLV